MLAILLMILFISFTAVTVSAAGYERWQTVAPEEYMKERGEAVTLLTPDDEEDEEGDEDEEEKEEISPLAWKKINGVCYNGSGKVIEGAITRGIDVSEWQGTINWYKVKQSQVDFAFVRVSYGKSYIDKKYEYNMTQAEAAGVPVGVYIYSLATTIAEAKREAKVVIEQMQGYKVSYPVVFDMEYTKMGNRSKKVVGKIAKAFCDEIKAAGYYPMVYCNAYWYDEQINWSYLSGIDVWIAQYGDKILAPSKNKYKYTIWQSTDGDGGGVLNPTKGLIDGIPAKNNVDVNFGYRDYTKTIVPRWKALESYGKPAVIKNGWVTENGKTYYYVKNVMAKGWQKISNNYYYFHAKDGYLYKSALLSSASGNISYVNANGVRVKSTWVTWKGKKYYIGSNGYAVKGWKTIGGKRYFFHKTKKYMYANQKRTTAKGAIYYLQKDGVKFTNGFIYLIEKGEKKLYYFNKKGRAVKGWKKIGKYYYYFYPNGSKKPGVAARNTTLKSVSGVYSVFNENGVLIRQYRSNS